MYHVNIADVVVIVFVCAAADVAVDSFFFVAFCPPHGVGWLVG